MPFERNAYGRLVHIPGDLVDRVGAGGGGGGGLADPGANGLVVRTALNTTVARTLGAPAAGLTIANPDGVAGAPTFALANDLAALEGLAGTGIAVRTAADTWAQRTVVDAGAGRIGITNPGGVAGNITLDVIESALNLANLGGTLGVAHGGTGANLSGTGGAGQYVKQAGVGATFTVGTIAHGDLPLPLDHHADLTNFTANDDHTQYLLLAGRAGGQIAQGGTAAADSLTLKPNTQSPADANAGRIVLDERVTLFPDLYTSGAPDLIAHTASLTTTGNLTFTGLRLSPTLTYNVGSVQTFNAFVVGATLNCNVANSIITSALFQAGWAFVIGAGQGSGSFVPVVLDDFGLINTASNQAAGALAAYRSMQSRPTIRATGASGSVTLSELTSLYSAPTVNAITAGGAVTVSVRRAVHTKDVAKTGAGTNTVGDNLAVDVEALVNGANNLAMRAAAAIIATYLVGSFTVPTGYCHQFGKTLRLTGSNRATVQGTGRILGN